MNKRNHDVPVATSKCSVRRPRNQVHTLLESELRDIRQSLVRLEQELTDNVVEIRGNLDNSKAA